MTLPKTTQNKELTRKVKHFSTMIKDPKLASKRKWQSEKSSEKV
jgi:hypothetical protein